MEIVGKIKVLDETKVFGANGFKKREVVITTDEQYPQHILIEFQQDKCDILNSYNIGDDVKVSINLRGREWINPQGEAKYFNSIHGWRIEKLSSTSTGTTPVPAPTPSPTASAPQAATSQASDEEDDGLPF